MFLHDYLLACEISMVGRTLAFNLMKFALIVLAQSF